MPSAQKFLKSCHAFLASTGVFSSFPLSLLLLGVEELIELKLSCPCSNNMWNHLLIASIFLGPFLFITALMFILLKPCRYDYPLSSAKATHTAVDSGSEPHRIITIVNPPAVDVDSRRQVQSGNVQSSGADSVPILQRLKNICCLKNNTEDDKKNKANEDEDLSNNFEMFSNCLIPPVIWIIILFLDGDYLACSWTTWKGHYVFNKELNRMWCQPTEQSRAGNESDLQHEYETFIGISQFWGYAVLGFLSFLIICKVCYFDCQRKKLNSTVVVVAGIAPHVDDENNEVQVDDEDNDAQVDDENDAHVDPENLPLKKLTRKK